MVEKKEESIDDMSGECQSLLALLNSELLQLYLWRQHENKEFPETTHYTLNKVDRLSTLINKMVLQIKK